MSEEKTVRIVRHAAERDFTILRNEAIRDSALTWKATGQLCYLLSLPADWRLRLSHLSKQKKDGRDSTRAGFKELEHAGYMWIEKLRDEKGKFVETVWNVSDMPAWRGREGGGEEANAENPCAENPNAGNPTSGNPTLQSTEPRSTDEYEDVNPHKERAEGQRPSGKRAEGPLSGGGAQGGKYLIDPDTKICLQAGNAQDLQALAEIKSHGQREIEAAVAQARAAEPSGRAYPTAVLRSLRRGRGAGGPAGAGAGAGAAPAWALAGAGAHASRVGVHEIDITDEGEVL